MSGRREIRRWEETRVKEKKLSPPLHPTHLSTRKESYHRFLFPLPFFFSLPCLFLSSLRLERQSPYSIKYGRRRPFDVRRIGIFFSSFISSRNNIHCASLSLTDLISGSSLGLPLCCCCCCSSPFAATMTHRLMALKQVSGFVFSSCHRASHNFDSYLQRNKE